MKNQSNMEKKGANHSEEQKLYPVLAEIMDGAPIVEITGCTEILKDKNRPSLKWNRIRV